MALRRVGEQPAITVDGEVARTVTSPDRADVEVRVLLDAAAPADGADHATIHSGDGLYTASIPLENLRRSTISDGRLLVPDGWTKCWNVKDVVRIEVTTGKRPDSVPGTPPGDDAE